MDVNALAAGTLLDRRYELEAPLGRGGMAAVYRALDRRLGRPVAVKVLDAEDAGVAGAAFREDQITARLAHPNIVGIYDSGETLDGRPYLVMELIDGEPVSHLAPLPVERALAIAEEVTAAVAHAHAHGVVHCDLKPQNVLLDAFGRARLTDFGVASAVEAPVGEVVYGSASYIAPERLRGAPTSPAVDIYALGATLYFLVAGRPPYGGTSAAEIIAQVRAGPPAPLAALAPTVPPAVDAIVRRAMAPNPADRFPSAAALRDALVAIRRASAERTGVFPVAPLPQSPSRVETATVPPRPPGATMPLPPAAITRDQAQVAPPAPPPGTAPPSGGAVPAPVPAPTPARVRPRRAQRQSRWLPLVLVTMLLLALLAVGLARAGSGVLGALGGRGGGATAEVPSLTGLGFGEAYHRVLDSGLQPGRVDSAPGPGQPANVVVAQDPPAGEKVPRGTTVHFVVRTAP